MMGKSVTVIIIAIRPTIKPLVGTKQGQWMDLLHAGQKRSKNERERRERETVERSEIKIVNFRENRNKEEMISELLSSSHSEWYHTKKGRLETCHAAQQEMDILVSLHCYERVDVFTLTKP